MHQDRIEGTVARILRGGLVTDEDPTTSTSLGVHGSAGVILLLLALVAGATIVLLMPYLPALVEWVLVGGEVE